MTRFLSLVGICLYLLLGGCSSNQLAYNNLDHLLLGWADTRLDLSAAQKNRLRDDLQRWHRAHRMQQLPAYIELLQHWQARLDQGEWRSQELQEQMVQVERHWRILRQSAEPGLNRLLLSLDSRQQQRLLRSLDESVQERQRQWLERTLAERQAQRLKRYRERLERWTGRLTDQQLNQLQNLVETQADPQPLWLAYRRQWNRQLQQALSAADGQRLSALIVQPEQLRNETLRQSIAQSRQRWSAFMAQLLNQLNAAQRVHLRRELQDLIEDGQQLNRE